MRTRIRPTTVATMRRRHRAPRTARAAGHARRVHTVWARTRRWPLHPERAPTLLSLSRLRPRRTYTRSRSCLAQRRARALSARAQSSLGWSLNAVPLSFTPGGGGLSVTTPVSTLGAALRPAAPVFTPGGGGFNPAAPTSASSGAVLSFCLPEIVAELSFPEATASVAVRPLPTPPQPASVVRA
jgi:hypothetical protein